MRLVFAACQLSIFSVLDGATVAAVLFVVYMPIHGDQSSCSLRKAARDERASDSYRVDCRIVSVKVLPYRGGHWPQHVSRGRGRRCFLLVEMQLAQSFTGTSVKVVTFPSVSPNYLPRDYFDIFVMSSPGARRNIRVKNV